MLQTITKTLSSSDILGLSTPYVILPTTSTSEFYDIEKIVWKLIYNTTPYEYSGDLYFCLGTEYVATFQADSITSPYSVATISRSLLCKDKCSPLIIPGKALTLECTDSETCRIFGAMSAPINGDSTVEITVDYYIHSI